jgi:cytochrome P450
VTATTASTPGQLRTVKGPRLGVVHLLRLRRKPIEHNDYLRSAYGEVLKLNVFGTTLYAAYGLDAAEQVLINRDRTYANGPAWSHFIGPFFRRGLMLLDFDEHLHHRRILQHAFTNDALRRYHAVMLPHIRSGIASWESVEKPRMHQLFKELTLDLALETFVGVDLTRAEQDRINKAFIAAVRAGTSIVRSPVPGTPWAKGLAARKVLEEFFFTHLPEKRRTGGDDLFAQLCVARSEDGDQFSDEDIVNHMIFLLMAAHDTTTITMSTMAYYLAHNREWQERCRAESLALGTPTLAYADLGKLVSLDLVMRESMRMVTAVPGVVRKTVKDTCIAGYFIPRDTQVTVNIHFGHQLAEYWPNPTRFDPERFSDERREDKVHRSAWIPFGGGVHKCIGLYFGMMQVKAAMHQILQDFDWAVASGYDMPIDWTSLPRPKNGLPVHLTRPRRLRLH